MLVIRASLLPFRPGKHVAGHACQDIKLPQAKRATNVIQVVKLIDEFDLQREAIPTQWLNEVAV